MREGVVIRLIPDKGFGFIRDSNGNELFFHRSAVTGVNWGEIKEKTTRVTFDEVESAKGPRAENVAVIEE